MRQWTSGMLAISQAGRDKGTLYVVLACEGDYVWLADGKRRRLDTPKKKKCRHVQLIRHLPAELLGQMQCFTMDAHVRKILGTYQKLRESRPDSAQ